jgi:hypothetical protein
VQLGLKGIDGFASGAHIVKIEDVTEFVQRQGRIADQKDDLCSCSWRASASLCRR